MKTIIKAAKSITGLEHFRMKSKIERFTRGTSRKYKNYRWDEFKRVALHFGRDGMGSLSERAYLFRLASDLPESSKIIEIGSWVGGSTSFLSAGVHGSKAKIYAVDTFLGSGSDDGQISMQGRMKKELRANSTKEIFLRNIRTLGFENKVEAIESDSIKAATHFPKMEVDMIFIDGDHTYEGCLKDIRTWLPYLKKGGIMAFHDFDDASGITKAVFETIREGCYSEIVGTIDWIIALRK
jgi:predicted O-methyltransferase YrrM